MTETVVETKTCKRCGETKPVEEFYWNPGRHTRRTSCILCYRQEMRDRRKSPRPPRPPKRVEKVGVDRECSRCKRTLDLSDFPRDASKPTGYHHNCRDCRSVARNLYRTGRKA